VDALCPEFKIRVLCDKRALMNQLKADVFRLQNIRNLSEQMIRSNYNHCLMAKPPSKFMQSLDLDNYKLLMELRNQALQDAVEHPQNHTVINTVTISD